MSGAGIVLRMLCACLAGLGIALQAHAQAPAGEQAQTSYTCCNFHYSGTWISDANWFIHPRIPAGTPVRVLEYGEHRVMVEIDGRAMTLGLDYGRRQNLREWGQRMIVSQDPRDRVADWPEAVRDAIGAGKVALGMTKEQVIVALGYPPAHATPSTDAPEWKYWYDTHGTYDVLWDDAGRLKEVVAPAPIRFRVLAEGRVEPTPAAGDGGSVQLQDLEGLLSRPRGDGK